MSTSVKLSLDPIGKCLDERLYQSIIGSLLYLTASKPDIAFSVSDCAKYKLKPKESHVNDVKRIMKYVSGTARFGIWLSRDTNMNLVGYLDVDYA